MAPRAGKVNKAPRRIGTWARVRDAEARKKRLNDLQAQSNKNIKKKKALESQIQEVERRLRNPEITNQAGMKHSLKIYLIRLIN